MSAPAKRRSINVNREKSSDEERENSDESDNILDQTEIQVDFEGRVPIDSDFHGIKQLLNQLFLKSHLNVTELAELIIKQNFVGSVIKQSEEEEEDEGDIDDFDPNDVFGVTTVINLTEKQKLESVLQLRELLIKYSEEYGSEEVASFVQKILSDDNKPVGLLINERFVNIPAQISVPLLKNLKCEITRAVEKKMAYDFSYLILICKFYKMELNKVSKKVKKSKKNNVVSEIFWSNPEEEIIDQEAELRFEFSVKDEADYGLIGKWKEDDNKMIPMRRVLVIPFSKFDSIIDKVEEAVSA